MKEIYPIGNTPPSYYHSSIDYFEERGLSPEDSQILVVGGELIAWHLKDSHPNAFVESIDIEPRTIEIQREIAKELQEGTDPNTIAEKVETGKYLEPEESESAEHPTEILHDIKSNVKKPDSSRVENFEEYKGEPDLIFSNNVYDYCENFMNAVERVDPDFLEMYTIFPPEEPLEAYSGRLDADVNPDVDFSWSSFDANVILFSDQV